jgi:hypothetical protein
MSVCSATAAGDLHIFTDAFVFAIGCPSGLDRDDGGWFPKSHRSGVMFTRVIEARLGELGWGVAQ